MSGPDDGCSCGTTTLIAEHKPSCALMLCGRCGMELPNHMPGDEDCRKTDAWVQALVAEGAAAERQHLTTVLADLLRLTYSVQLDSGTQSARKESERVADAFRARIADHCRERDDRLRRDRAAALTAGSGAIR